MKNLQKTLKGIGQSFIIGFICYFMLYGLILTGVLRGIPIVVDLFQDMSQPQIFWFSAVIAVLYFACKYLSNAFKSIFSALFLLLMFFWVQAKVPGFWQAVQNFWHSLLNLVS